MPCKYFELKNCRIVVLKPRDRREEMGVVKPLEIRESKVLQSRSEMMDELEETHSRKAHRCANFHTNDTFIFEAFLYTY